MRPSGRSCGRVDLGAPAEGAGGQHVRLQVVQEDQTSGRQAHLALRETVDRLLGLVEAVQARNDLGVEERAIRRAARRNT